MRVLITLCGRGGSKGIPGKNIKLINGKALIGYSIDAAKKFASKYNADIAVTTDSIEIRKVAEQFGIVTQYLRPAELATDSVGKMGVLNHVLLYEEQNRGVKYDFLLDLDITSPLRSLNDLEKGFELLLQDENALNLFSVNNANRNPYFNMVEKQENGYYGLIKKGVFKTRQSSPPVYDMNASFYFFKRKYFDMGIESSISERSLVYVMPHICFDLDHPADFDYMEYLLSANKLDFDL